MEKSTDFWWRDEGQEFSKIVKASAPLSTKAPTPSDIAARRLFVSV